MKLHFMAPFVWHQRILLAAFRLEFIRAFIILYFFNYKQNWRVQCFHISSREDEQLLFSESTPQIMSVNNRYWTFKTLALHCK